LNYYNEFEPFAAQWLENLVRARHLGQGLVDSRSIKEVKAEDVKDARRAHFFAGIGVWEHALQLAGWPKKQPVWTGSCPCQPFSVAGRGLGVDDPRHLWPVWFELIRECRPPVVFGEQVASPDGLAWLDAVRTDLEGAGYAVGAADLCAAGVGAPHIRQRLYFVGIARDGDRLGNSDQTRLEGHWRPFQQHDEARREVEERHRPTSGFWRDPDWVACRDGKQRPVEPGSFPLAHGAPARVGRLRAYGNAVVSEVAATFIKAVMQTLEME